MKKKSFVTQILFLSGMVVLWISCDGDSTRFGPIMFDRYRSFIIHSEIDLNNIEKLDSQMLMPYTVDDTIYILSMRRNITDVHGDDLKNNIASGCYDLYIFTKSAEAVTYRIKKMTLRTANLTENIESLLYYKAPFYSDKTTKMFLSKIFPNYYQLEMGGGYFKYPLPKDRKFSIDLEIEKEKEGVFSTYKFTYDYKINYKDHWFRLLS